MRARSACFSRRVCQEPGALGDANVFTEFTKGGHWDVSSTTADLRVGFNANAVHHVKPLAAGHLFCVCVYSL